MQKLDPHTLRWVAKHAKRHGRRAVRQANLYGTWAEYDSALIGKKTLNEMANQLLGMAKWEEKK